MTNPTTPSYPASFAGMKDADYRNAQGLSKSMLTHFMRSPAHYQQAIKTPMEPTKAMNFGTAFHAEMLMHHPESFYAIQPEADGRTKEGKAIKEKFALENEGKTIISQDEGEMIKGMRDSIMEHSLASSIIENRGLSEFSMFAKLNITGSDILLKGRFDAFNEDTGIIMDIKTCEDASPAGFKKAIMNYKYDIQDVHYTWLAKQLYKVHNFFFIAVEKTPPYAVGVYEIGNGMRRYAEEEWTNKMFQFSECTQNNIWPAYSQDSYIIEA